MEGSNDRTEQLQETVEGLKDRLTTVQFNLGELRNMLQGVVNNLHAKVEGIYFEFKVLKYRTDFARMNPKHRITFCTIALILAYFGKTYSSLTDRLVHHNLKDIL